MPFNDTLRRGPARAAAAAQRPAAAPAATLALVGALLAGPLPAAALQVVDARDGVAVEAVMSIKEPTRIRIDGAAITDVVGNLYSSNCGVPVSANPASGAPTAPPVNPAGEVVLECDRDKGEIYIRPVGSSGKPVNLFVSSAHATYTLVQRRSDTPADTIVIRDRSRPGASLSGSAPATGPLGAATNTIRTMKALLVAMASDRVAPDIRVDELHQPMRLWAEAGFTLMRRYEGRGLVGEKYLLTNTSSQTMVLAEQEFDRPDSAQGGQVLGVAVAHHQLRPGESTSIYIIRRGGQ
jgi:conjugal transfer pilus assembly protein TraK